MTKEIDIVNLQIQAEELVRSEYESAWRNIRDQQVVLERQQIKWANIASAIKQTLLESGKVEEDDLPDADAVLDHAVMMLSEAFKFQKMFKLIESNELLKAQWDRLVMSIRLAGGDQND